LKARPTLALLALWLVALPASAQKFYPDDPIAREPKPLPVAKALNRKINDYYDYFQNTFFEPDKEEIKHHTPAPSEGVNTLGEVPDTAWFTNRIGSRLMSIDELVCGPGDAHAPNMDKPWTVVSAKNEGVTPGLVIKDSASRKYFLKFDPKSNPELASAADVLGSKFFYALGYNVPENYIVYFGRPQLAVTADSKYTTPDGRQRQMTARDIEDVLDKAPRDREGRYRGLASLTIPGDIIGPFRYYGTRKDDPNDIYPHENRRDLRGLYVFAAWLNHTDSKSINSLDSVVEEDGGHFIRHYLIDFGAILGSDSFEAKTPRGGNVYLFDWKPAAWQFLSLGLYVQPWMLANFPDIPAAGRIEYEHFDPETWKNNYPNPAFDLRTPGDTYWAAKKVMAFTDDAIRAVVRTARYTDPRASDWISKCLIERRNKIGRAFLNDVLALDNFAVRDGRLAYDDLSVKYGFHAPREYTIRWAAFDNANGQKTPIAAADGFAVPHSAAQYLAAEIRADQPRQTVTVYLRGNQIAGIDRTW
jgi:hypothetical protein